jgi:hypothetical protein
MSTTNPKLKLIAIAAMFFGPLLLAFYFYYGHGLDRLKPTTQKGHLVSPARSLPQNLPAGAAPWASRHWVLLLVNQPHIDAQGLQLLTDLQKVRLATEKDKDRVQVALLQDSETTLPAELESVRVVLDSTALATLGSALSVDQTPVWGSNRVYLIDPNGNLLMWYDGHQNLLDVLNDLLKLLRLSHIG